MLRKQRRRGEKIRNVEKTKSRRRRKKIRNSEKTKRRREKIGNAEKQEEA